MSDFGTDHPDEPQTPRLDPASQAAFDRWVELGFENGSTLDRGSAAQSQARAIQRLLSLLDTPVAGEMGLAAGSASNETARSSLLVDVTLARVQRERSAGVAGRIASGPAASPALANDSRDEIDALVESGWPDSGRADARSGAMRVLSLLATSGPMVSAADRDRLIESTLARVQEHEDRSNRRFRLSPVRETGRPARSWGIPDLGAVAAVLLIGAGVLWPMHIASREQSRASICSANMSRAAMGFSLYANDHAGAMPQAQASFMGGPWWQVGKPEHSHSANLFMLVSGGYSSLVDLSCPGNAAAPTQRHDDHSSDWRTNDEVSFSYQLPSAGPSTWGSSPMRVILADRSPVVQRSMRGETVDPGASSRNHAGLGQNLLFGDGSVRFHITPVLQSGDNIWLPGGSGSLQFGTREALLKGTERPSDDQDTFLGP